MEYHKNDDNKKKIDGQHSNVIAKLNERDDIIVTKKNPMNETQFEFKVKSNNLSKSNLKFSVKQDDINVVAFFNESRQLSHLKKNHLQSLDSKVTILSSLKVPLNDNKSTIRENKECKVDLLGHDSYSNLSNDDVQKSEISRLDSDLCVTRSELLEKFPSLSQISAMNQQLSLTEIPTSKSKIVALDRNRIQSIKDYMALKKVKEAIENLKRLSNINTVSKKETEWKSPLINDNMMTSEQRPLWITLNGTEQIEKNWHEMNKQQHSAIILMDENILINNFFDLLCYDRYHKLFTSRHAKFYLGRYKHQTALIKKISIDRKNFDADLTWISIAKQISSEMDKLTMSTYCPFAKIYEMFYLPVSSHLYVFMEPVVNKTLHYHIKQRRPILSSEARRWSSQLLNGICFLQNRAIVHRSLRLEHLVLDQTYNLKIINWRRAISFWTIDTNHKNLINRRERRIRKNNHLPPEAFRHNYDPRSIDVWSFGVVLCSLATHRYPFKVMNKETYRNIEDVWCRFKEKHQDLFQQQQHQQIVHLLDKIFVQEPNKRANVTEIQKCNFFYN